MKINVDGVSFKYNGKSVLEDVTFTIKKGSFCAIIGPNGAGKSTLLKILERLLKPHKGCVFLDISHHTNNDSNDQEDNINDFVDKRLYGGKNYYNKNKTKKNKKNKTKKNKKNKTKNSINDILEKGSNNESNITEMKLRELSGFKRSEIAEKIGYIPQYEENMFPATVFDTILMGRKPYFKWNPRKVDLDVVAQVIEDLDLGNLSLRKINEMSGGQRQKVIFGRALAQNPEIFLLDEPTANLDLKHQLEILYLLKNLTLKGKTVVIAIHDLNLALKYCDKFIMLRNGTIYDCGNQDIISEETIEKVYGVEIQIIEDESSQKFIIPKRCVSQIRKPN